jgi:hypothetical protein
VHRGDERNLERLRVVDPGTSGVTTFEALLGRKERSWPYGDSCAFCAVGNHRSCLGSRWLVSKNTSHYDEAMRFGGQQADLLITGGVCGCGERKHEGARGVRSG